MANEIGYWVGTARDTAVTLSTTTGVEHNLAAHHYTASSNEKIETLRVEAGGGYDQGGYIVLSLVRTSDNYVEQSVSFFIAYAGGIRELTHAVNWPLAAGNTYKLVAARATGGSNNVSLAKDSLTDGEQRGLNFNQGDSWAPDGYIADWVPRLAGDVVSTAPSDNIDTDNNIDQHQRDVALNHSLASPLTSVLINSVEHIDLIQNSDTELKYIKRCYDAIGTNVTSVVVKNGVDTDVTISDVTVNTTHPYPAPNGTVDSNSMFSGVTVSGSNASFRITSQPTKGVLDLSDPAKFLHNIDASKGGIYTPNPGATGTDSFTFEVHDPDEPIALNRTQSGTVTINIVEGEVVPEPIVELVATIIITGPSELIHKRGTTYTDQGATALDGEGADITSSIIITNNVNDTVVGDYYVYYRVSGVTVRRKVNVVEITDNSLRLVNRNRVIGF